MKFFQDISTYYNNPKQSDGSLNTFNAIIMGRKTWESMGKWFVLIRDLNFKKYVKISPNPCRQETTEK